MTTTKTKSKRKSQQSQAVVRIVIIAAILVCINVLASRVHFGLDLTSEKRFTLSDATKEMLARVDDPVTVDIYMKGEFPAGIEHLRDAVAEKLNNFNSYTKSKITYTYIDPFEGKTEDEKGPIYQQLAEKGVVGIMLDITSADNTTSQKMIFPYALVHYKGKSVAVRIMESGSVRDNAEKLTISESLLEYKLASAIHKMEMPAPPEIAYMVGHGEPLGWETYDMLTSLSMNYFLDTLDLVSEVYIPSTFDAIIINKPATSIKEQEKLKLDQYVMRGGRILWCLDPVRTPLDSLQYTDNVLAIEQFLNLDDMLFNYGVRVNADLVQDMQCFVLPVTVGRTEQGQSQIEGRNWMYYPIFLPTSRHPIVNNMDGILGKFVSSIDTVGTGDIKKTVLLESSKYSRRAPTPHRVSLSMLQFPMKEEMFQQPYLPAAVLVEGNFESIFRTKISDLTTTYLRDVQKRPYMDKTDSPTAMIVIGDGDIFLNEVQPTTGPIPMGASRGTKAQFANRNFLLNCMEYLTDKNSLLEARTKDARVRLLDGGRVKEEGNKWRIINIAVPVAIVLLFASAYLFFRKRRYAEKK